MKKSLFAYNMDTIIYITPEEFVKRHPDQAEKLEELQEIAKEKPGTCDNCDYPEWKAVGAGLCFTCTTGESDASEDYELTYDKKLLNYGHI